MLKTGTLPERLFANKRNISSSSGLAAKRKKTAVEKAEERLTKGANTYITVNCI